MSKAHALNMGNFTGSQKNVQTLDVESYSKSLRHQKIFRTVICILFCIIALLPFVLLVMNATRSSDAIKSGISLIPSTHLLENWKNLMAKQNGMQITLQKAALNSLIITVPGTFLSVYFSSLTAYGIFVYDFKLKKFAWAFIMAIMMVPSQISIIGFYRFMLNLGMVDTYIPLIIPTIASPAVVFFMKQYMESTLSLEMIEAARIDGSRELNTFNKIIIPIMKPAVATQAIFQFIAQWNNLFTPTIMLTTDSKKTLPMFVQLLSSNQFRTDYGVVYVGLFVTIIPLVVVYLVLSKYIVAGVALGGVKG
jgi:multiple sugar transport system permease protein